MKNLVKLILEKFEDEGRNGESERQLDVVVRKEKEFVKGFSREQWKKYNDLEGEKLDYHDLRLEHAIRVAIRVLRKIYNKE